MNSKYRIIKCIAILIAVIALVLATISPIAYADKKSSDGYTDEQKAAAKAWLSSHGYAPTRAGANQAYQDYLNGKFDNDPEVQKALGKDVTTTETTTATTEDQTVESEDVAEEDETEEDETDEEIYVVPDDEIASEEQKSNQSITKAEEDITTAAEDLADTEIEETDDEETEEMEDDSEETVNNEMTGAIDPEEVPQETNTEDVIWMIVLATTTVAVLGLVFFSIFRKKNNKNEDNEEK